MKDADPFEGEARLIDLDPGPGVAMRWTGAPPAGVLRSGFLLKLAPDASLLWAQAFPEFLLGALAPTGDGGVLMAGKGPTAVVAQLGPDGAPGWTFAIGGPGGLATAVAVRGSSFVVAGANEQTGDFDPGPGTQIFDGGIRFLSRFDF